VSHVIEPAGSLWASLHELKKGFFGELQPVYWHVTFLSNTIISMETMRTIVLRLQPTPEQATELDATLRVFVSACDYIAHVARREHTNNMVLIQGVWHRDVRETFGLSPNLVIRSTARLCTALKVPEKAHSAFKPTSIDYDARILSFRAWDRAVTSTLLNSRQRIETEPGEHRQKALMGTKPTAAQLLKRDGGFLMNIQIGVEFLEPVEPIKFLGFDPGIAKIVTSENPMGHSGAPVEKVRREHNLQRNRLQRKWTKGPGGDSGDYPERTPGSSATRAAVSASRSSRPPKTRDGESTSRTSRGFAVGYRLRVATLETSSRVGRSISSPPSFGTRLRTQESSSRMLTPATSRRRVASAGIARKPIASSEQSVIARTAEPPLVPIGTPPGASGLWSRVTRPQN